MSENNQPDADIDWSLTTWDGARREAMRRWSQLPLEQIIAALEEMEQINQAFSAAKPVTRNAINETPGDYIKPDPK
jgi:hypothetical protein